jgi:hypothetical protein
VHAVKTNFALCLEIIKTECNEVIFKLIEEGPSVMYLKQLQEKLAQVESMQGVSK